MTLTALIAAVALDAPLFFNIAPYSPGNEKTVAADMREYVARTGNRKVLYSLTLHPEGKPAMAKVEKALASYRALKAELAGSDVELGVLLQAILGHWPRTDKEVEPWQRTVNQSGEEVRFCWLDSRYQDYIRTVAKLLAAEKPSFILGDDDIRAFSPEAECFCPLHVAEFNRRRGTSCTSGQMRAAVKASKAGDPDFETFMTLQREQVNGVCRLIREGIDSVDPTIPAGTCMPGWEYRFNDQASRAIAAKGQPTVMRFGNGNYNEKYYSTLGFDRIIQKTQSYFAFHKDKVDFLLSEADTYPHHLWSRSATSWHAHLAMSLFTGLKGAKLWFVNAHKGRQPVNRNYTDILAENSGFYRTLAQTMEGSEPLGLVEPCLTRFVKWHPSRQGGEQFVEGSTWATAVLGRLGVPFACDRDYARDGIWTLAGGAAVERLTDDDLRAILAHRVLIDGCAAVALTKRGFADLIGVSAAMDSELLFNQERDAADRTVYRLTKSDRVPRFTAEGGVKELAYLAYSPYTGATEVERVAPGTTLFRNRLGGTVVATAWHLGVSIDQLVNEGRQDWLGKILAAFGDDIPRCLNRQDVTLLAVFNLNYDPMKTIDLRMDGTVGSVERLEGDGSWKPLAFTCEDGLVKVASDLACYGTAILRVRR